MVEQKKSLRCRKVTPLLRCSAEVDMFSWAKSIRYPFPIPGPGVNLPRDHHSACVQSWDGASVGCRRQIPSNISTIDRVNSFYINFEIAIFDGMRPFVRPMQRPNVRRRNRHTECELASDIITNRLICITGRFDFCLIAPCQKKSLHSKLRHYATAGKSRST